MGRAHGSPVLAALFVRGSVLGNEWSIFIIGGARATGHGEIGAGKDSDRKRRVINSQIFRATANKESGQGTQSNNRSLTVAAPFRSVFRATANEESS